MRALPSMLFNLYTSSSLPMTDTLPAWYALPSCTRQVGGLGGILLET